MSLWELPAIIALGSVWGDLVESAIKRELHDVVHQRWGHDDETIDPVQQAAEAWEPLPGVFS